MIAFVATMVWRETRSAWRRLLFFVFCIAFGVGGLIAVKSFGDLMERAILLEARTLSAADLTVRNNRPFGDEEIAALKELRQGGAEVARTAQFVAMTRKLDAANEDASAADSMDSNRVRLVEVRAVEPGYPFYGEVITGSGGKLGDLLNDNTALVDPALLIYLDISVGDVLRIGSKAFTIADTVIKEPDGTIQLFRLGPRVMLTMAGAMATGLIVPTSRVRYSALVKLHPAQNLSEIVTSLRSRLEENFARVDSFDAAQPRVRRFLNRLSDYLRLIGLVALLLGGIGVSGAMRVFIAQKIDTLAILKCLGATSQRVLAVYVTQAVLLGLVGAVLGAGVGVAVQQVLAWLMADFMPVALQNYISPSAIAEGIALGLLVTLWFALPPLWRARKVPPAHVFRRTVEPSLPWRQRAPGLALYLAASVAILAVLTFWQSGNAKLAWIFLAALTGTGLLLVISASGMLLALRHAPRPSSFILRQGLTALYRPGNQTVTVTVSLGLGVLLVLTVFLIRSDLLGQVTRTTSGDQPNLFFMDIQKHQRETFKDLLQEFNLPMLDLVPLVRGRIRELNGVPVAQFPTKDEHAKRALGFEYAFTYRDHLQPGETIVAGAFERDPTIEGAQVSASQWWIDHVGLGVGDRVTLDIQGVPVSATINSIRKIDWSNRRANFSFVFLPGVLEQAPQVFVSAVRAPDELVRVRLQQEAVARMPNISVIDVQVVLGLVQDIMDRIAMVVQFMALFSIAVGLVILGGMISTTKYQRMRESVLMKTLGATRWMVARMLAAEYLLLGLLAGLVGAIAAGGLSWGLVKFVFRGQWYLHLAPYLWGVAAAVVLVVCAGLLSSLDVLMKKPLQVLREE